MTVKQQIIGYLQRHPDGVDDDLIAAELNLASRQQANSRCRELAQEGLVVRRVVNGKIHNFWVGNIPAPSTQVNTPTSTTRKSTGTPSSDWFWEGNVQSAVVSYLSSKGYRIRSVANTATHAPGKDIIAERSGQELWVSVKGYPRGTEKTNPATQARHWFQGAVFDVVLYRGEDDRVALAIALPDYARYRKLAEQITWFKKAANFSYLWVRQDGSVAEE